MGDITLDFGLCVSTERRVNSQRNPQGLRLDIGFPRCVFIPALAPIDSWMCSLQRLGMSENKQSVGVYLDSEIVADLDEIKRERDRKNRDDASRSAVAADAIELGLVAMEFFESRDPDLAVPPRKTALHQALEDLYAPDDTDDDT